MTSETNVSRPRAAVIMASIAVLFGVLTLKSGGEVLFFDGPGRAAAGNYVPFVLWFNFIAGFAYIAAGVGLYLWRGWAVTLSLVIAAATLLVSAAFSFHVLSSGAYEMRTVGAMALRSVVWLAIAFFSHMAWNKGSQT